MLALEANIPPSPTRFNLFGKPSWALNRTKIKTNTDKPKVRVLCKLHNKRHVGHLQAGDIGNICEERVSCVHSRSPNPTH